MVKILILLTSGILFMRCSTAKYLSNCNNLLKSDSTEYFVSGLMDHQELKAEWIKKEINKDSVSNWLKNYSENLVEVSDNRDSLSAAKIIEAQYRGYMKNWDKIENKITTVDKIFYYSTPGIYWDSLAGQNGLVVIRNCKIMYVLIFNAKLINFSIGKRLHLQK